MAAGLKSSLSNSRKRRASASARHALARPLPGGKGISNDCGGRVAPTRFYRSVGNDIESYRCLQSRARFSQASLSLCKQSSSTDRSAGFYRHSKEDLQAPESFPAIAVPWARPARGFPPIVPRKRRRRGTYESTSTHRRSRKPGGYRLNKRNDESS
jgi:hypothetical protein